ncbi:hypothetical protein B2M27_07590 [Kluyvera intermedia]|uniref:Alpha/beta hydrolase n=2 Tax=Kluyvera intermedia TaxID=61648 RepID=A0ABX3UHK8_KLUIN|nr:hypothetical protein B2M27_07590 [Kluyvera intermedia]
MECLMEKEVNGFEIGPVGDLHRDYYLWRAKDIQGKRLFVVFSSRGAGPGNFSFYKTFERLNVNVLHITPSDFSWYQNGLVSLGDDLPTAFKALSERLDSFCLSYHIHEVICLGASMGGYGALVYGALSSRKVNTTLILFGTETVLKLPYSKSAENHFEVLDKFNDIRYLDYSGLDVNMIFGEFDIVDSFCALSMKYDKNFSLYSCACAAHIVPEYLNAQIGIVNFFNEFLSGGRSFIGRGHMATELYPEDIYPLLFDAPFSENYNKAIKRCIEKYPAYGFAWNRLGVYLHQNGKLMDSLEALKRSHLIHPAYQNTLEHLKAVRTKLKATMN